MVFGSTWAARPSGPSGTEQLSLFSAEVSVNMNRSRRRVELVDKAESHALSIPFQLFWHSYAPMRMKTAQNISFTDQSESVTLLM
jgi:hypothetical protein